MKTSWRDLCKTSSRHLEDVFKTSWTSLKDVLKTSWTSLEDVLKTFCKTSWRHLEDILKMCWQDVLKPSWRRLENILKRSWRRMKFRNLEPTLIRIWMIWWWFTLLSFLDQNLGTKIQNFQIKLKFYTKNHVHIILRLLDGWANFPSAQVK